MEECSVLDGNALIKAEVTRKPWCRKETERCSVLLPTANDSSIVIYIHCIKAEMNVKL